MYSKLWKFYGIHWLLFTSRFRGKIVIISAWLRRNIAIALCFRRVASFLQEVREQMIYDLFFRFLHPILSTSTPVESTRSTFRTHIHTHKFILHPLFRLFHFSRPPLLTSSRYLSPAAYSSGKNILGQEWDLWICRAKSWVVFMVQVLLPHFRAYRVTMSLCQWCK